MDREGGRLVSAAVGAALFVGMGLVSGPLVAQTAITAEGLVESTSGGLKFPDGSIQATAAAAVPAAVEDTGQQTCYDPSGSTEDMVACVLTGQDGEKQAGADWPAPRFTDNLDGTVTDSLTGLIWLQDANCASFGSPIDFQDALSAANGLSQGFCGLLDGSFAGDWRLPNVKELLSLCDYSETGPALPSGHPFASPQDSYWSSSWVSDKTSAWLIHVHGRQRRSGQDRHLVRLAGTRRTLIAPKASAASAAPASTTSAFPEHVDRYRPALDS